jgi:AAA family ATP:ADP antiporter
MIAAQVAGKAARDALFLSNFSVSALPLMMASSAIVSLVAVLWLSRMIVRHSPARVVPACFAIGGAALLLEWAVSFPAPRVAAVALHLHLGLFGSAVISGFWSLVNETFDPRSGKRAVSWIAAGATLGGVFGGAAAWAASSVIAVSTMLPLLGAASFVCFWATLRLRPPMRSSTATDAHLTPALSPLHTLRASPYLRNLAAIVGLGAITSGLLDFIFSAEAVKAFSKGPALLSFFALFWLGVGVLSFALQASLGRLTLEKLGLAGTLALVPGVVVLGGATAFLSRALWSAVLLRGAEAVTRNSIFRGAYELLYTPLAERKKRATKTLIDVGVERLGTVAASAMTMVALRLWPDQAQTVLLAVAVGCGFITLGRTRQLQKGYVAALQESLRREAARAAGEHRVPALPTLAAAVARDAIADHLNALPHTGEHAILARSRHLASRRSPSASHEGDESLQRSLLAIVELCSGDATRVRSVLNEDGSLAAPLVPFAIMLLASSDLQLDAAHALRKISRTITGQLADALCGPSVEFDIRKRVARVLAACPTQQAADALIRGTRDDRFEVRYECGRALLNITGVNKGIRIPRATVIAIVKREAEVSKEVWESQPADPELDDDANEPPALIHRLLRDRFDRSLEHVFSVLALHLDRESLRIAFAALHREDPRLRGTALEYLETVLPQEIRDDVWPFLGEARPMRAARPPNEILEDLVRAADGRDGAP